MTVAVLTDEKVSEKEAIRRRSAARGLNDLYFFCAKILGNTALYEPFHRPMCRWLDEWQPAPSVFCGGATLVLTGKKKKLLLAPRGHIKSNVATIGKACQEIARNPNIRILLGSHKYEDATKFTRKIKRILESPNFQYFYPHVFPKQGAYARKPALWRDDKMLVNRTVDQVENTVECSSTDAMVTGRHYDLFFNDDLVTAKSVSESGIRETRDFHEAMEALADPGSMEIINGTRYDFSDRYGEIIDTPNLRAQYDVARLTAFMETNRDPDEDHDLEWLCHHGTPVFPTRFVVGLDGSADDSAKVKSLLKILHSSGPKFFSNQYMNDPQDPTKQTFTEALLQTMYVDALPVDGELAYFRVCDLSGENETKESYTAIVTGAVDHNSCIYITDVIRQNMTSTEIVDELFRGQEVAEPIRPKLVGFEPAAHEKSVKNIIARLSRSRGTFIPVQLLPITESRKAKPRRIFGLHAWVTSGLFKVLKTCRNRHYLHSQLYRHPATIDVDVADACAQIPIFMFPGKEGEKAKAESRDRVPDDIVNGYADDHYIGANRVIGTGPIMLPRGW